MQSHSNGGLISRRPPPGLLLKTKIATKEIKTEANAKHETIYGPDGTAFIVDYDRQFTVDWQSDDKSCTCAKINVFGARAEIIVDAIHRYLKHKFPMEKIAIPKSAFRNPNSN